MTNIIDELNELAGAGLIAVRSGPALAELLEELPGLGDALGKNLQALAAWFTEDLRDGDLGGQVAEAATHVTTMHEAAERAQAIFAASAAFWLTEGAASGASCADAIAEAMAPGFLPDSGDELQDTMEGLPEFARYLEESLISIGEWYDEVRGSNDQPTAQLLTDMRQALSSARDALGEAGTMFDSRYSFWTQGY